MKLILTSNSKTRKDIFDMVGLFFYLHKITTNAIIKAIAMIVTPI